MFSIPVQQRHLKALEQTDQVSADRNLSRDLTTNDVPRRTR